MSEDLIGQAFSFKLCLSAEVILIFTAHYQKPGLCLQRKGHLHTDLFLQTLIPAAGKWSHHCEPGSDGGTEDLCNLPPRPKDHQRSSLQVKGLLVPKITSNMRRITSAADKQCALAHLCISVTYSLKLAPSEWSPNSSPVTEHPENTRDRRVKAKGGGNSPS